MSCLDNEIDFIGCRFEGKWRTDEGKYLISYRDRANVNETELKREAIEEQLQTEKVVTFGAWSQSD